MPVITVERPSASTLVSTSVSQPLLEQDVDFLQAELDLLSELDNEEQQRDKFSKPQEDPSISVLAVVPHDAESNFIPDVVDNINSDLLLPDASVFLMDFPVDFDDQEVGTEVEVQTLEEDQVTAGEPDTNNNEENINENGLNNSNEKTPRCRKRMRHPENTKKAKAKRALNLGEAHLNSKGQFIAAKEMGAGCDESCRFKCHSLVSEAQRRVIHKHFYGLGDHTRQLDFIKGCTITQEPKDHNNPLGSKRMHARKHFFVVNGTQVRVCQTMFLSTLSVSQAKLRTISNKLDGNGEGVSISPDKRGRHSKVSPEKKAIVVNNVKTHINSFPRVPSHYCRANSQREYLEAGLNIRQMYRLYQEWMPKHRPNDKPVSEKMYRDIFNENFNISFFQPKKDKCALCTIYENATPAQKAKLQTQYENHISDKDLAKETMKKEKKLLKENKDVCVAAFDLQSVLYIPQSKTSVLFYNRKMSVYNLTMVDSSLMKAYCYMWDESEASRGANEIASCTCEFVETKVKQGVTEFHFWTDNCSAQNKNKYLFSLYTYLCSKYNIKIYHKYLETGHTYNDCDTVHSNIEKAARHKDVYVPTQWQEIVQSARKSADALVVVKMNGKMKDFHQLADQYQQWNHKAAKWSKVKVFHVTPLSPGKVFVKHHLEQETFQEISIRKASRPINLATYQPPPAYFGPLKLKKAKLKDLASMCNDLVIPSAYHDFYKKLEGFPDLTNPLLDDDDDEDEPEVGEIIDADWLEEENFEDMDTAFDG